MSGEDHPLSDEQATNDKLAKRRVLHIEARSVERRLPSLGVVRFRSPTIADERGRRAFDAGETDARAFANALIAVAIQEPRVSASDVDTWSERTRAIARVATAEVSGCLGEYRRLAGSGRTGDERLLAAMHAHNRRIAEQFAQIGAMLRNNVSHTFEQARFVFQPSLIEKIERQRRQIERLVNPHHVDQLLRVGRQMEALRRPLFAQNELRKLQAGGSGLHRLIQPGGAFDSLVHGYANAASDLARQFNSVTRPAYFDAFRRLSRPEVRPTFLVVSRLTEQLRTHMPPAYISQIGRLFEELRQPHWLGGLRSHVLGFADTYYAWLEREWSSLKAGKKAPPVAFLLASLPAIIALPLLKVLKEDDEPLLARLEAELTTADLVDSLQAAVQGSKELDSVGKQHLVRGLEWVREGQYVDAAPPLCQGLERAFLVAARRHGVIDGKNRFLIKARRAKAQKTEDLLPHLGLDVLYIRFLRAWIFGETGNQARHGDLAEDEHRRWVLRSVIALVGWLEYLGGEEDATGRFVARLELERGSDEDEEAV
jgi:hypothetical protein